MRVRGPVAGVCVCVCLQHTCGSEQTQGLGARIVLRGQKGKTTPQQPKAGKLKRVNCETVI